MLTPQSLRPLLLCQLLTAIAFTSAQPIQVAGTLDSSFNPSGFRITATGASITGGYPGSIIIDLGDDDLGNSVASFNSNGERIIIGGRAGVGVNRPNFALVVLSETGALDSSFNPSGSWISSTGASYNDPGGLGYAGSIVIDLGSSELANSVATFDSNGERIIMGGVKAQGPGVVEFALVVLNEDGSLDSSFNPSGVWISSTGASYNDPGGLGYSGSIVIDLGGNDQGRSVATFKSVGERIIIGGSTNAGENPDNFALVVLTQSGTLDHSFNPSGFWISSTGTSYNDPGGLGYSGSIVIDLGGDDEGLSVTTFDSDGERIIIGGLTDAGGNNDFALVVLNEDGSLDRSFNPSGLWINSSGISYDPGAGLGYSGSIVIDLGGDDRGYSVTTYAFDSDGERIIIGGFTNAGDDRDFALVVLNEDGSLDRSFNPSGFWINSSGISYDPGTGLGYSGSIVIDLGGDDYDKSITTFDSNGERIIIGGYNGPFAARDFALVVLNEDGSLDRSFNPSGYRISETGASIPGSYSGSILIDLGGDDFGESVATFDSNGERIIIGGRRFLGGNDFALVVLNGETIFPTPIPPLNPLLALPFVAMAAA